MSSNSKQASSIKQITNPLETLRDSSQAITKTFGQEVVSPMVSEAWRQLLGIEKRRASAEIRAGGSIDMSDLLSGKHDIDKKKHEGIQFERRIFDEERVYVEGRMNEIRLQIHAIHEEIVEIAKSTPELDRQIQMAVMNPPIDASAYELNFLSQLLSFMKSFRKKIESAGSWLAAFNARSSKKNMWGTNYKKHGAKYLLSGEHYLQRSAG